MGDGRSSVVRPGELGYDLFNCGRGEMRPLQNSEKLTRGGRIACESDSSHPILMNNIFYIIGVVVVVVVILKFLGVY
jgi:hypothetical protein